MQLIDQLRIKVAAWPYVLLSLMAALASFGAYTCMYAFRKAFAAGTYTGHQYFHIDYKVWLVIAQVLGYTISKFYGIRFIAEVKPANRAKSILILIGVSWLALLGFALIPAPYNILMLFINGFPLGMIWGLVFGYLEGRRATEFMAAVMSISLIFASGFVKTTGRTLMSIFPINEYYMPFLTGALFVIPLLLFVFCLELLPPPTAEDKLLRAERTPMSVTERKVFLLRFLPGILLTIIIYVMLTIMRDVRDNFEVEIWQGLGVKSNSIYTNIDTIISVIVLAAMSLLILIRKNMLAFGIIHLFIIAGCVLAGVSTLLFDLKLISPVAWMTMAGLGLYLGYVPYNAIFFERMIASFNYRSNVGFIMYVADAMGYLGSISILLVKELVKPGISWDVFFRHGLLVLSLIGTIGGVLSLLYFLQTAHKQGKEKRKLKLYTA
jgi:MFS family permease